MVSGAYENEIQLQIICQLICSLDKNDFKYIKEIQVIMDKKLAKRFQDDIRATFYFQIGFNTPPLAATQFGKS